MGGVTSNPFIQGMPGFTGAPVLGSYGNQPPMQQPGQGQPMGNMPYGGPIFLPGGAMNGPIQVPINGNNDAVLPSAPVQGKPDQINPATGYPFGMQPGNLQQAPDGDVSGQFPDFRNPNLGNPGGNYDNQMLRQFSANAQLLPKMTPGGNVNSQVVRRDIQQGLPSANPTGYQTPGMGGGKSF